MATANFSLPSHRIYGLNVHVTCLYYVSYPDDSTMLKAFVSFSIVAVKAMSALTIMHDR